MSSREKCVLEIVLKGDFGAKEDCSSSLGRLSQVHLKANIDGRR